MNQYELIEAMELMVSRLKKLKIDIESIDVLNSHGEWSLAFEGIEYLVEQNPGWKLMLEPQYTAVKSFMEEP